MADDQQPLVGSYGAAELPTRTRSNGQDGEVKQRCTLPWMVAFGVLIAALVGLVIAIVVLVGVPEKNNDSNFGDHSLAGRVKVAAMMKTLGEFQTAALASVSSRSPAGTRGVGSQGYELSAQYVERKLNATGKWTHERQYFFGPVYTELAPPQLALVAPFAVSYQLAADFSGMRYGGNGSFALADLPVLLVPNGGCSADDWAGFAPAATAAAYAQGGLCTAYSAALLAQQAGAAAFFIYSRTLSNTRVRAVDWSVDSPVVTIPTLSITTSVAQAWMGFGAALRVNLTTSSSFDVYETFNIIATYVGNNADGKPLGDGKSIVAIGSHLDSVQAGPGINDDGSGSATNLELAVQWPQLGLSPVNRYQAMWWGSEEEGLIGSRYFVAAANQSGALPDYALYINMDMLAGPNYILEILDGNTTAPSIRTQSTTITQLFEKFFDKRGVPWALSAMTGGSDFLPFIEAGVPSSGLLTGAGGIKTTSEREIFGGIANAAYDPCYHQACDTVPNINQECLAYTSQAAASVLQQLLMKQNLREFLLAGN